jgi:leader peptidase (prepilin peptidase)/N-methyltransferase
VAVGELTVPSTVSLTWALAAVAAVVVASPLLAGWAAALVDGPAADWWRPRSVRWPQVAVVAGVAAALAVAATSAQPRAAWLILAAGGAVLCVVDVRTGQLPVRLTITLAAAEMTVLGVSALATDEPSRLLRTTAAAGLVGGAWLCVVVAAPRSLGLGDVWVAALCGGLLGWSGWSTVLAGQAAAWVLAVPVAVGIAAARPTERGRHMHVPLGPAILAGAVLAAAWV